MKLSRQFTVFGSAIFCVVIFSLYLMLDRGHLDYPRSPQREGSFPQVSARAQGSLQRWVRWFGECLPCAPGLGELRWGSDPSLAGIVRRWLRGREGHPRLSTSRARRVNKVLP